MAPELSTTSLGIGVVLGAWVVGAVSVAVVEVALRAANPPPPPPPPPPPQPAIARALATTAGRSRLLDENFNKNTSSMKRWVFVRGWAPPGNPSCKSFRDVFSLSKSRV